MGSCNLNEQVESILEGSFDLHVHSAPDPLIDCRFDAIDTGLYAQEADMAGFALMSAHYTTVPIAGMLSRMYPGLNVVGGLVLNHFTGGLNIESVQAAADLGARILWMSSVGGGDCTGISGQNIQLIDKDGKIQPQVEEILDIVDRYDMLLAHNYASSKEALSLFRLAKEKDLQKMLVTYNFGASSTESLDELASLGVYVEYPFENCMPSSARITIADLVSDVRSIGVENCVITSGFGQSVNPPSAEGMRMAIATLLNSGLEAREVSLMVKVNPLSLVSSVE